MNLEHFGISHFADSGVCFAGCCLSATAFVFSKRFWSLVTLNLPSCYFTFSNCSAICISQVQTLQHPCVGFAAPIYFSTNRIQKFVQGLTLLCQKQFYIYKKDGARKAQSVY